MSYRLRVSLIGGLVLFLWGIFSWSVLPWHTISMAEFKNDGQVSAVLRYNAREAGIYRLPSAQDTGAQRDVFAMMFINPDGLQLSKTSILFSKFLASMLSVYIAITLIHRFNTTDSPRFVRMSMTLLGLFAGVTAYLPPLITLGAPLSYTLVGIADHLIGFILVGILAGALTKPTQQLL